MSRLLTAPCNTRFKTLLKLSEIRRSSAPQFARNIVTNYAKKRPCCVVPVRFVSTGKPEPGKFHKVHPSILERLSAMEDSLRVQGYSVLRIGLGITVSVGAGIYLFRNLIRANVADEVSTVATMSLGDSSVQMKVQELAVALIHTILTEPNIQAQTVQFVEDVAGRPATKAALTKLLLDVITEPSTQTQLAETLKSVVDASLGDEDFRARLGDSLSHLLAQEGVQDSLLTLVTLVLRDERTLSQARQFLQDVLSSNELQESAVSAGRQVLRGVVADSKVQKQTGDALWSAFTYSITPRVFGGRLQPDNGTMAPAAVEGPIDCDSESENSQDSDSDSDSVYMDSSSGESSDSTPQMSKKMFDKV